MSILAGMRLVVFKHSGIWFIDKDPTDSNVSIQADLEGVYSSHQASDDRYMSACLVVIMLTPSQPCRDGPRALSIVNTTEGYQWINNLLLLRHR